MHAEMGRLLALLLLVQGLLALTLLPALAALLGAGPAHRETERRTQQ